MDQSHLFSVEMAKKYGVNAAIMIRHFQFWISKNKANGKHQHDGRTWTYCSVKAFTEIFKYWTSRQIRVILDKLLRKGVIIKGNYNPKGYDHTTWYAFKDEKRFVIIDKSNSQKGKKGSSKTSIGIDGNDRPIPNPITNDKTDKSTDQSLLPPNEMLELDLKIAEGKKFFLENLPKVFHNRINRREAATFARITLYLIAECQACRLKPSIFYKAIDWAKEAMVSNAASKKALFVSKVKQSTGFKAQKKLLVG